jgi:hypothetical protein
MTEFLSDLIDLLFGVHGLHAIEQGSLLNQTVQHESKNTIQQNRKKKC